MNSDIIAVNKIRVCHLPCAAMMGAVAAFFLIMMIGAIFAVI